MTAPPRGAAAVLFVCTGNICRSPAAELLLRAGLGNPGVSGVEVASAGIAARAGEPVAPPMARLLAARGVEPAGFVARQLEPAMLRSAGLVLTMTAEQRAAVVTHAPAVVRRTFTLREFADLAELGAELVGPGAGPPEAGNVAGRLAALVAAAPRVRGLRTGAADLDVEDPYGLPPEVHARALGRIETAIATVLGVLSARAARSA